MARPPAPGCLPLAGSDVMLYDPSREAAGCCGICVFLPPSRAVPILAQAGHVQGALAHRAQRGLPLTWPRPDYIALPVRRKKNAAATGSADAALPGSCRAHVPPGAGRHPGVSREDGPAGAAAHSPTVKDHSTYPGAQATSAGYGAVRPMSKPCLAAQPEAGAVQPRSVRVRVAALTGAPTAAQPGVPR